MKTEVPHVRILSDVFYLLFTIVALTCYTTMYFQYSVFRLLKLYVMNRRSQAKVSVVSEHTGGCVTRCSVGANACCSMGSEVVIKSHKERKEKVGRQRSAEGGNLLALFVFVRGCSPCLALHLFLFTVYQGKQFNAIGFAVNIAVKGYNSSVKNVLLSEFE